MRRFANLVTESSHWLEHIIVPASLNFQTHELGEMDDYRAYSKSCSDSQTKYTTDDLGIERCVQIRKPSITVRFGCQNLSSALEGGT